jgi:predicted aspartyl protease
MFDFLRKPASAYERAARDARGILKANPHHRDAWRTLAVSCVHLQNLEDAMDAARSLLRVAPDWAQTFVVLGDVRFARGSVDRAEQDYHSALSRDGSCAAAYYGLARVASARADYDGAVSRIASATGADPMNPDYAMKLARTRVAQHMFVEAAEALARYLQIRPSSVSDDQVRRLQRIAVWFLSVGERETTVRVSGGSVPFSVVGARYLAVDASVDGLQCAFVVDTGAEPGLTIPPSIVNTRYRTRVLDYGVQEVPYSNKPVPVRYVVVDVFECAGAEITALPAFDFRLPVPEEVATFNPLCLRGVVRFDFSTDTMTLIPTGSDSPDDDAISVGFHVFGSHGNHAYVPAFIAGRGPFNLLVDTSVADVSITERVADVLRLSSKKRHAGVSVRLGGHDVRADVTADFAHEAYDDGFVPDGALGTVFLRRFRSAEIDYTRRLLVLRTER